MSNKRLLEETTVEKFMKLAKIDASRSKKFLTENFNEEVVEEATEEVVEEATDYNSMTVAALRDILSERGLTVRGTKAELVARLEADDSGPSEEAPDEPAEAPSEEAVSSDEMPEEGDVSESGEQEDS